MVAPGRARTEAASESSYRSYLIGLSLADPSIKNRLRARRTWLSWCAETGVDPFDASYCDVSAYYEYVRTTMRQSSGRLRMLGVRSFYNYLEEFYGVVDPTVKLRLPKQISRPVEPFTPAELKQLYAAAQTTLDRALILLLVGTGLRDSEVGRLKQHHINWYDGTIVVLGKGAKYRTVAPGPAAMEALRQYFASPSLWGVGDVGHDWLSRWLKRLGSQAGLKGRVHLHRMRYTFAVEFSEAGGGIDLLQTLLGHSSIEMSMFYSRKGRERRALEAQRRFSFAERLVATEPPSAGIVERGPGVLGRTA